MKFKDAPYRRRPDAGLTFDALDEPYAVYHSDQVGGIPVEGRPRWLAIYRLTGAEIVIGRKRSQASAERCCNRHSRALRAAQREKELGEAQRIAKKRRMTKTHRQLATCAS